MEAAPRLPMISFELKTCTEITSFATKLKQYIASFYHEDPESYNNEIHNLQKLRGSAVLPTRDVAGVQTLKKYYCQLKFLRSRFPMDKGAICATQVSWKDPYAGVVCSAPDIDLELMSVLYNVGALHSQLGSLDSRQTPEGMKMACTHFQCAAWAFKEVREIYPQAVAASLAHEVLHFMEIVCLAQAQECILEKSMTDSRKCTIIAKVAAQAVSYYEQAGQVLSCQPEGAASEVTDIIGSRVVKDWCRYIKFKSAYHNCISLLYQGQHCEEQQKMGERCALYQASADKLEEARKLANGKLAALTNSSSSQAEIEEALAFTLDVVEGKRKAARNENEFIYHETVPEKDTIPPLQGASLVRPIPFGINDPDVSGPDIFARLVPMEAHEASSIYSEKKAELLRRTVTAVEERDRELEEFMTSLHQIDILLDRLGQPQVIPQEIVDRAAALNARPQAVQALIDAMAKLSSVHLDVDSLLNESHALIEKEKEASSAADRRQVVSMPINDLSREAAKYREALNKASESNEALHRAMSAHVANLKVLAQPLSAVDKHLPKVILADEDRPALDDLRKLIDKVEEMSQQRVKLVGQLREATRSDDITSRLAVNRDRSSAEMETLFDTELAKHRPNVALIEQNLSAQQNILHALTDSYAKLSGCRKQIVEAFRKRDQTIQALIASYDAYEDLLAKVNKGIDFYQKLETNVNKLLQRLRSTCRVQEEEREQKNASNVQPIQPQAPVVSTPKLRDYLQQPGVGVRPAPLGSEHTDITKTIDLRNPLYATQFPNLTNGQYHMTSAYQLPRVSTPQNYQINNVTYPQANINYQSVPTTYPNPVPSSTPQAASSYPQNYSSTPGNQFLTSHASKVTQSYPAVPQSPTQTPQSYQYPQNYPPSYQNVPKSEFSPQKTTGGYPNSPNQNRQAPQAQLPPYSAVTPNYSQKTTTSYPGETYPQTGTNYQSGAPHTAYPTPQTPQNGTTGINYQVGGVNSTGVPQGAFSTPQTAANPIYSTSGATQVNAGYQIPQGGQGYPSGTGNQVNYQYPTPGGQVQGTFSEKAAPKPNQYSHQVGTSTGPFQGQTGVQNYGNYPNMYQTPQNIQGGQGYQVASTQNQTNQYQPQSSLSKAPQNVQGYQVAPQNQTPQYQPSSPLPKAPQQNVQGQGYQVAPPQNQTTPQGGQGYQVAPPQNQTTPQYQPQSSLPKAPQQNVQGQGYQVAPQNQTPQYQPPSSPLPKAAQPGMSAIRPASPYQTYPGYQGSQATHTYPNTQPNYQYPTPPNGGYYQQGAPNVPQGAPNVPQGPQTYQGVQNYAPGVEAAKKNSNVDLLAGLDFNINQAPLDPVKAPLESKDDNREVEISSTDIEPLQEERKVAPDPERWKKEQSFEKDLINLEHWVTNVMESELETRWKVLQKENDHSHVAISVARCYPGRNRCPDSLPYDRNRFELPCPPASDDYINASKIQIPLLPPLIVTQAPLPTTIQQFWTMVANSQADLVVCLMTDSELQSAGLGEGYWRMDYGAHLKSTQVGTYWTERIMIVAGKDVSHLQLTTTWPTIGSGDIINGLAELAFEITRRRMKLPIVVHCLTGIGRSGVLSVLLEVANELVPVNGLPVLIDPLASALRLAEFRKNPLHDRLHLEFTYRSILKMARMILPKPFVEELVKEKVEPVVMETKDPLSDLDPLWKLKINN